MGGWCCTWPFWGWGTVGPLKLLFLLQVGVASAETSRSSYFNDIPVPMATSQQKKSVFSIKFKDFTWLVQKFKQKTCHLLIVLTHTHTHCHVICYTESFTFKGNPWAITRVHYLRSYNCYNWPNSHILYNHSLHTCHAIDIMDVTNKSIFHGICP